MANAFDGSQRLMTGYLHRDYAESQAEFGDPRELPCCGGWLLKREVPGFPSHDAMGCYPIFACRDWRQLHEDFKSLGDEVVALSLVTDPFGNYDEDCLRRCFRDVILPFKEHFVVDLHYSMKAFVSNHHRYYARKALRDVSVERCENSPQRISDWMSLYAALISRHRIKGIPAFSSSSFARQFGVPGLVIFRAMCKAATVGMTLWYVQEPLAYCHLGAYSLLGYKLGASFALFWRAIAHFAEQGLRWLNLGAGSGTEANSKDGLSFFKRGWSTGTRPAYFCGRIFDRKRYLEILKAKEITESGYFPAYRVGEFA